MKGLLGTLAAPSGTLMGRFVAIWNRNGEQVDKTLAGAMLEAEVNPLSDGRDVWSCESICLAHEHFWLTPEEVGEQQPLVDLLTGCVFTGSVRLDNRAELIPLLANAEPQASQVSDARLLLLAYLRWGSDCPTRLLGDFAFVIWDPREQRVFAARDPLGAEDLLYTMDTDHLLIASTVSMLLRHPAVRPELNEEMVAKYLALLSDDEINTYYQGIVHLPPAHSMTVDATGVQQRRYWEVDPGRQIHYKTPGEYAEHFRALLMEAVRCRLRLAGPVGVSLSGGLDSTTLACLAAQLLPGLDSRPDALRCYSYVFDAYPACDEREYIEPVINQASAHFPTQSVMVNGDHLYPRLLDEDWPVEQEGPAQDPYLYLLRAILASARAHGTRALLSGFVGDDLYAGDIYLFADLMMEGRFGSIWKILQKQGSRLNIKQDMLTHGLFAAAPRSLKKAYRALHPAKPGWLGWIPAEFARSQGLSAVSQAFSANPRFKKPGQVERYHELFHTGYAAGVCGYNRLAWEFGLVFLFPYFDRRVVEFALALPTSQVGLPGYSRRILRNATRDILPEKVRQRASKTSFVDLSDQGIYSNSWSKIGEILTHPQVVARGWVSQDWLSHELARETRTQEGYVFWLVLCLELWLRHEWQAG